MKARPRGRALSAAALTLLAAALTLLAAGCTASEEAPAVEAESATVVRVVDGDTLDVDGAEGFTVRLLGIDAPEAGECGALEATQRLEQLLPPGTDIVVIADPVSDATDRYGRRLAYIETSSHGDLGALLVTEGLTGVWWPSSEPAPTRASGYEQLRDQARDAGTGSWGPCGRLGRG